MRHLLFYLKFPTYFKTDHKHPVLFKIPYFKTNHKTSYPNNTFQNKNIKTTHFLSTISLFFFFHFLSTLLKRLCITMKYIKSKFYFSIYGWLFLTNLLSSFLHQGFQKNIFSNCYFPNVPFVYHFIKEFE